MSIADRKNQNQASTTTTLHILCLFSILSYTAQACIAFSPPSPFLTTYLFSRRDFFVSHLEESIHSERFLSKIIAFLPLLFLKDKLKHDTFTTTSRS